MASGATISKGAKVTIKVGSAAAVQVKGFKTFGGLRSGSAAVLDATDQDSTAKEKLMGLPDEGQLKLSFNAIAADPGQVAVIAARAAQTQVSIAIVTKAKTYTMDCFILTAEMAGGVDTIDTLEVTAEITGSIVESVGA